MIQNIISPPCAAKGSFHHLVGGSKQRVRYREAERLGVPPKILALADEVIE